MKQLSWKQVVIYLIILAGAYLIINAVSGQSLIPGMGTTTTEMQQGTAVSTQTAAAPGEISVNDLPPEGRDTLKLIKAGGPFPYSKDGTVFSNIEGLLPKKASGYYREYTVITPGSPDRGARRIVAGAYGEYYYTSDHYRSFKLIKE